MSLARLDPNFLIALNKLQKLHRTFPKMAGIEAERFSKDRFIHKNWVDKTVEKWVKPNPVPDWVPKEWRKKGGSLLVGKGSGRLKRSVRRIKFTTNSVTVGTDVPYAEIHNEGGTIKQNIKIKAHSRKRKGRTENVKAYERKREFKIPQRKFIGESSLLLRWLERVVEREMTEILK